MISVGIYWSYTMKKLSKCSTCGETNQTKWQSFHVYPDYWFIRRRWIILPLLINTAVHHGLNAGWQWKFSKQFLPWWSETKLRYWSLSGWRCSCWQMINVKVLKHTRWLQNVSFSDFKIPRAPGWRIAIAMWYTIFGFRKARMRVIKNKKTA